MQPIKKAMAPENMPIVGAGAPILGALGNLGYTAYQGTGTATAANGSIAMGSTIADGAIIGGLGAAALIAAKNSDPKRLALGSTVGGISAWIGAQIAAIPLALGAMEWNNKINQQKLLGNHTVDDHIKQPILIVRDGIIGGVLGGLTGMFAGKVLGAGIGAIAGYQLGKNTSDKIFAHQTTFKRAVGGIVGALGGAFGGAVVGTGAGMGVGFAAGSATMMGGRFLKTKNEVSSLITGEEKRSRALGISLSRFDGVKGCPQNERERRQMLKSLDQLLAMIKGENNTKSDEERNVLFKMLKGACPVPFSKELGANDPQIPSNAMELIQMTTLWAKKAKDWGIANIGTADIIAELFRLSKDTRIKKPFPIHQYNLLTTAGSSHAWYHNNVLRSIVLNTSEVKQFLLSYDVVDPDILKKVYKQLNPNAHDNPSIDVYAELLNQNGVKIIDAFNAVGQQQNGTNFGNTLLRKLCNPNVEQQLGSPIQKALLQTQPLGSPIQVNQTTYNKFSNVSKQLDEKQITQPERENNPSTISSAVVQNIKNLLGSVPIVGGVAAGLISDNALDRIGEYAKERWRRRQERRQQNRNRR